MEIKIVSVAKSFFKNMFWGIFSIFFVLYSARNAKSYEEGFPNMYMSKCANISHI